MRKYLNMENATLDIKLNDISKYEELLTNNIDCILLQNFKRIHFHIKEEQIIDLVSCLKKYFIDKEIFILINTHLTTIPNIELPDNFAIINTNSTNIINDSYIHNLIPLTNNNLNLIIESINNNLNIIVDPVIDIKEINSFMSLLDTLLLKVNDKEINLNGFLIPSFLMREHPCNAYLCNGWKCGKKISQLPKYLTINENNDIYPHDLFYDNLKVGNIKTENLIQVLNNYFNSQEFNNFQHYCKQVFIKYLAHYPYDYMPLIDFIRTEVEYDKQS